MEIMETAPMHERKLSDEALIAKYPELFMEAKNFWRLYHHQIMRDTQHIKKQGYHGIRRVNQVEKQDVESERVILKL